MLIALAIGFALLMAYGKFRGCTWGALWKMAARGVISVKNIAIVMLLVGALTALWKSCGTITFIVSCSAGALSPALFLPATFVLCAAISVLTGTSIGTAATMGVICMSVGEAMNAGAGGASGWFSAACGGAILSGAYFGDRCSPVSTSALLVAEITHTNLYDNIRGMIRTGWIPTVVTLGIYGAIGFLMNSAGNGGLATEAATGALVTEKLSAASSMHWYLALPAISILILAIFRIDVKINMLVSIAIASALFLSESDAPATQIIPLLKMMLFGMVGMLKLIFVVLISLTYAGLFKETGILDKLHTAIEKLSKNVPPAGCTIITAIATSALACNQTLAIVLTNEICTGIWPNEKQRALALENTAVIIAPLVPWTVASLVPLGTIGAPVTSILFAFFLILTPVMQLIASGFFKNRVQ